MIYKGNKELSAKYKMIHPGRWMSATEIYQGALLVWTAIRSCFGSGCWHDDKPWLDTEAWKDK